MAGASRIYWVAPAVMIASLVVGFFFALGHHLFYASLAGTPAPTGIYHIAGADVSRQQLNTAIGTAFGFLVKSFLSISISIAFIQAFWKAARDSTEGTTLKSLDHSYALLNNFRGLFEVNVWKKFPIPLLLAAIAWCVPIASIITPATLSVQNAAVNPAPLAMAKVPNFDFSSLNFAAPIPKGPTGGFCFNGPSQPVERIAAAVAAQGQVLPISAPASNATWSLEFWGPSLQCDYVEGVERTSIWTNILDQWGNVSDCSHAYGYLAWAPTSNNSLPFVSSGSNDSTRVLEAASLNYDLPASFYVATVPQMFNFAFLSSNSLTPEKCRFFGSDSLIYTYPIAEDVCLPGVTAPVCYGQQSWFTDASLLRCDLMNSSYLANFAYTDGVQSIDVTIDHNQAPTAVTPHQCFEPIDSGNLEAENLACNSTNGTCPFDEGASKLVSYQGIVSAFNKLILGSITMGGYGTPLGGVISKTPGIVIDSNVATTILMDTEQLSFVANFNGVNETFTDLQRHVSESNSTGYRGISNALPTGMRGDLKSTLEMLFQNFTLSLLADDYLQPNYSSPYAPEEMTSVTFTRYHNVYLYSTSTLWAAYGLAIFFTMVAVFIGLILMAVGNASFTHDFSTIVRIARTAPMSEVIQEADGDGRQPLPDRLAVARMMLGSSKSLPKPGGPYSVLNDEQETPSTDSLLLLRLDKKT